MLALMNRVAPISALVLPGGGQPGTVSSCVVSSGRPRSGGRLGLSAGGLRARSRARSTKAGACAALEDARAPGAAARGRRGGARAGAATRRRAGGCGPSSIVDVGRFEGVDGRPEVTLRPSSSSTSARQRSRPPAAHGDPLAAAISSRRGTTGSASSRCPLRTAASTKSAYSSGVTWRNGSSTSGFSRAYASR